MLMRRHRGEYSFPMGNTKDKKGGRMYDFKRRGDSTSEKNGCDGCR